jgi:SAM-dependent methyltransferase
MEHAPDPPPSHAAFSSRKLQAIRNSRRHPRRTQFDYLHVRYLLRDLTSALARRQDAHDVLDVWCGSRPYEDLLPPTAQWVGLDVEENPYGVADVVSNVVLPFADESFDLVTCIEAFQWIPDPQHAVSEFRRVLRPGGSVLVTLPFAFEYDRAVPESRYTEHELRAFFEGWTDLDITENGGRAVVWTVLTESILAGMEQRLGRAARVLLRPVFGAAYVALNGLGGAVATLEDRYAGAHVTLPMNLMLTAERPLDA